MLKQVNDVGDDLFENLTHWSDVLQSEGRLSHVATLLKSFPLYVSTDAGEVMLVRMGGRPVALELVRMQDEQPRIRVSHGEHSAYVDTSFFGEEPEQAAQVFEALARWLEETIVTNNGLTTRPVLPQHILAQVPFEPSEPSGDWSETDSSMGGEDEAHPAVYDETGHEQKTWLTATDLGLDLEALSAERNTPMPGTINRTKKLILLTSVAVVLFTVAGAVCIRWLDRDAPTATTVRTTIPRLAVQTSAGATILPEGPGAAAPDQESVIQAFSGHQLRVPGGGTLTQKSDFKAFGLTGGPEIQDHS
jgi:hypothetical protein